MWGSWKNVAPFDYNVFSPVKDALCGCHFAYDNELKQRFHDVLLSWCRDFTTLVYSVLFSVGKSVLKMMETLLKNSHIIAKDVWIIHINYIDFAVEISKKKKKNGGVTIVLPLVLVTDDFM
jgi:hypothetical protein